MEKTVLEGVVEEAYDTGNTWKSPQGRVFNIISVKIDVDGEILEGTTMSGKFKEGSKVSFTKEPDKYNDGKWKFKYESGYTGQSNGQTSVFPSTNKSNYMNKGKGSHGSFAAAYAKDVICKMIEKGEYVLDSLNRTENIKKDFDELADHMHAKMLDLNSRE